MDIGERAELFAEREELLRVIAHLKNTVRDQEQYIRELEQELDTRMTQT